VVGIRGQTDLHTLGLGGVALDELVVDRVLDEDARTGGAAFAVEREDAEDRGVDGRVEVRIGEDHGR
jgi:hypothetical protein